MKQVYVSFIPSHNIKHPETNQILIFKGDKYAPEYIKAMAKEYGFDNIKGTIVIDKY